MVDEDFLNDYLYSPLKSDYEDRWNDEHSKEVSQYEVHGHIVTPDDYIKAIGEARLLGIFDIADNYRISIREVL